MLTIQSIICNLYTPTTNNLSPYNMPAKTASQRGSVLKYIPVASTEFTSSYLGELVLPPLYDAISPRLHYGYLLIMLICFVLFTSNSFLFLLIWTKFTTSLPARGYTQEICDMILKKILHAKGADITTDAGHAMIRHGFGFISHNL